jgi:multidrug efflux system membrane fusion protein
VQLGPQGPYVFVVTDGHVVLRPITITRNQGGEAIVAKGVVAGEQIVVDGQLRLVNGAPVTVRPAAPPPAATGAPPRG